MELSFENETYNKLLEKLGVRPKGFNLQIIKVLIPFVICWAPLAIITIYTGHFWTGNVDTSFITNFDSQVRFLISLPILILSEKLISSKLGLILNQFKNSGIIKPEDFGTFHQIVEKALHFLKSKWTFTFIIVICYFQVFSVLTYENEYTSILSWQIADVAGEEKLNIAGKWNALISRPIVFFLFLQWLLRIMVWGWMLRKISMLNLNLFPIHPDLAGGLGFLGYALRFFSPIAFAISAAIAGNMIDFILIEGIQAKALILPGLAYLLFISLLFTIPLLSFMGKLIEGREKSVFENYDFANGIYRELRLKFSKGYDKVTEEDLKSPDFSAASDLSAVVENALKMKYTPFTLRDLLPLWVMTILPFLAVVLIEVPIHVLFKLILSFLV